jgi:hypothetical protein
MTELELLQQLVNQQAETINILMQIELYMKYVAYAAVLYFFVVAVKAIYYLFGKVFFGGI